MKWFRFYSETRNDPKVQLLPADLFRHWVNIMCLMSEHETALPSLKDIAFACRMDDESACQSQVITPLIDAGLLDIKGKTLKPHNWDNRQYKSDVSTSRVKRFRKRQRNVSVAAGETVPDSDSDTESRNRREGEPASLPNETTSAGSLFPKEESRKTAHGEFGRTLLTDGEYSKLSAKLKGHLADYISRFDFWVAESPKAKTSGGVKREDRSPYMTITGWFSRDLKDGKLTVGGSNGTGVRKNGSGAFPGGDFSAKPGSRYATVNYKGGDRADESEG